MKRTFESNGMIWDDGEIPACSYCGRNIDEADGLWETPYSGQLCCEDKECRIQLADESCEREVEETTEEEDEKE